MGHLGQGTQITTVEDKEIVLTSVDGQHFRMQVSDLAEAIRKVMRVATNNTNGLIPSIPLHWGPTPAVSSLGYLDFKTDISNSEKDYYTIEIDIHGIYTHNQGGIQDIHLSFVIVQSKFSSVYCIEERGNGHKTIQSIILYKGSDGYIHIVINVNNSINVSGGYLSISAYVNQYLSINRVISMVEYKAIENYVDGTNSEEIKYVLV